MATLARALFGALLVSLPIGTTASKSAEAQATPGVSEETAADQKLEHMLQSAGFSVAGETVGQGVERARASSFLAPSSPTADFAPRRAPAAPQAPAAVPQELVAPPPELPVAPAVPAVAQPAAQPATQLAAQPAAPAAALLQSSQPDSLLLDRVARMLEQDRRNGGNVQGYPTEMEQQQPQPSLQLSRAMQQQMSYQGMQQPMNYPTTMNVQQQAMQQQQQAMQQQQSYGMQAQQMAMQQPQAYPSQAMPPNVNMQSQANFQAMQMQQQPMLPQNVNMQSMLAQNVNQPMPASIQAAAPMYNAAPAPVYNAMPSNVQAVGGLSNAMVGLSLDEALGILKDGGGPAQIAASAWRLATRDG